MEELFLELYKKVQEIPYKVYDVFKEFYGEEYVDIQFINLDCFKLNINTSAVRRFESALTDEIPLEDRLHKVENMNAPSKALLLRELIKDNMLNTHFYVADIIVKFPKVVVTNEYDNSVEIQDLFIKIPIDVDGHSCYTSFSAKRSTFTKEQFNSRYVHSHIHTLDIYDLDNWENCCVGLGPIANTIGSLRNECDYELWNLFCLELKKWTEVESLEGIPYIKMSSIGINCNPVVLNYSILYTMLGEQPSIFYEIFNSFIEYITKNNLLIFNYANNSYSVAYSPIEITVRLTDLFIDWYNNQYINKSPVTKKELLALFFYKGFIKGNEICTSSDTTIDYSKYEGNIVLTFKNSEVPLHIIEGTNTEKRSLFLNRSIICYILTRILQVLNYEYKRNNTYKKIRYI